MKCSAFALMGGLGIASSLAVPAVAGISQSVTASPGGFVQAGAYPFTCGCGTAPGADLTATFGTGGDFREQAFSGLGSAQQSASFSNGSISNSASGTAGMGLVRMTATNASPDATWFAAGMANGGWKETYTFNHPTLGGQAGFLVFQIHVQGTMNTTNLTGAANFQALAYKDGEALLVNPLYDPGDSDPLATSYQSPSWGLASAGVSASRSVDDTVTMAVPITFGQPFTLGIYAWANAGQRAVGGFGGSSSASLDFSSEGLSWGGIVHVESGGITVLDYTIVSGSGIDWAEPVDTTDLDGDGATNALDCAPLDPGAFSLPAEATGAAFAADGETLSWVSSAPGSGPDTVHDVMRGALPQFPIGSGAAETCLDSGLAADSTVDASAPAPGEGFYYLVRGANACGVGTYGFATGGAERNTLACP
jgi:hypothetical protein